MHRSQRLQKPRKPSSALLAQDLSASQFFGFLSFPRLRPSPYRLPWLCAFGLKVWGCRDTGPENRASEEVNDSNRPAMHWSGPDRLVQSNPVRRYFRQGSDQSEILLDRDQPGLYWGPHVVTPRSDFAQSHHDAGPELATEVAHPRLASVCQCRGGTSDEVDEWQVYDAPREAGIPMVRPVRPWPCPRPD